jgi:hypothetical protein
LRGDLKREEGFSCLGSKVTEEQISFELDSERPILETMGSYQGIAITIEGFAGDSKEDFLQVLQHLQFD